MIAIAPNTVGEVVSVVECLRQTHEHAVERREKRIEKRRADGVPDSDINFEVATKLASAVVEDLGSGRSVQAKSTLVDLFELLADVPMLSPFKVPEVEGIEDLKIRIRHLSDRERAILSDPIVRAQKKLYIDNEVDQGALVQLIDAQSKFVERTVAYVEGIKTWDGKVERSVTWESDSEGKLPAQAIEAMRSCGVMSFVVIVATTAQNLEAKKAKHFGELRRLT